MAAEPHGEGENGDRRIGPARGGKCGPPAHPAFRVRRLFRTDHREKPDPGAGARQPPGGHAILQRRERAPGEMLAAEKEAPEDLLRRRRLTQGGDQPAIDRIRRAPSGRRKSRARRRSSRNRTAAGRRAPPARASDRGRTWRRPHRHRGQGRRRRPASRAAGPLARLEIDRVERGAAAAPDRRRATVRPATPAPTTQNSVSRSRVTAPAASRSVMARTRPPGLRDPARRHLEALPAIQEASPPPRAARKAIASRTA